LFRNRQDAFSSATNVAKRIADRTQLDEASSRARRAGYASKLERRRRPIT
jgi:hypothetical protein